MLSIGDIGKSLKREAKRKDIQLPNYLKRWINVCNVFPTSDYFPVDT